MRNKIKAKVLKRIITDRVPKKDYEEKGEQAMKIATIDGIKLVLEMIFGDHYLKTYFSLRFKDLHIGQPIAQMVSDFAEFRNGIVKEKVDAGKDKDGKPKLSTVTRTITLT